MLQAGRGGGGPPRWWRVRARVAAWWCARGDRAPPLRAGLGTLMASAWSAAFLERAMPFSWCVAAYNPFVEQLAWIELDRVASASYDQPVLDVCVDFFREQRGERDAPGDALVPHVHRLGFQRSEGAPVDRTSRPAREAGARSWRDVSVRESIEHLRRQGLRLVEHDDGLPAERHERAEKPFERVKQLRHIGGCRGAAPQLLV